MSGVVTTNIDFESFPGGKRVEGTVLDKIDREKVSDKGYGQCIGHRVIL